MTAGAPGAGHWSAIRASLEARPFDELSAAELDRLAEAFFWLDEPVRAREARREAYRHHLDAADELGAAMAAWWLFYEHHLVGEVAVANGWLERCHRQVETCGHDAAASWLEIALVRLASHARDADGALDHARRALVLAERVDDPNLSAMAAFAVGRAEIDCERLDHGIRRLDGCMVAVINEELDPHFTGWVYCNVISTCMDLADFGRASAWSDASLRWCASLEEGRFYPGLCRVYAAELALHRGEWDTAEHTAREACGHLEAYDPRFAGSAHYLVGEVARLRGHHRRASAAYERAYGFGHVGQPGRALLAAAQGRGDEARAGLSAVRHDLSGLRLAQGLVATVDLAIEAGAIDEATHAQTQLEDLVDRSSGDLVRCWAEGTAAMVSAAGVGGDGADPAARDRATEVLGRLARTAASLDTIGVPYEAARFHLAAASMGLRCGDHDTGRLECRAAQRILGHLGASGDLRLADRLAADLGSDQPSGERPPNALSDRELEVLELLADGATNREIAARLHISRHTVSRHVSNIFTKLGVHSRAAATTRAHEQALLAKR